MAKKFFVPPPRKPEPPKEEKEKTYLEKFNAIVGKSKIASAFVIVAIVLGGIATATGNIEEIGKTVYGWFSSKADSIGQKTNKDSLSDTLKKDSILNLPKRKFSISGIITLTADEKRWLEDSTKMEYSKEKTDMHIEFGYMKEGKPFTMGDDVYYSYGGSSISLIVAGVACDGLRGNIPAISGQRMLSKTEIKAEINKGFAGFISTNRKEIIQQIITCLKK